MELISSGTPTMEFVHKIGSRDQCLLAVDLGKFRAAQSYYERVLQQDAKNVRLAIDYGVMLYRQCRYGACYDYFCDILSQLGTDARLQPTEGELQVIKIIRCASALYSKGSLRSALKEARVAHQWLREKTGEQYSEDDVSIHRPNFIEIADSARLILSNFP
jgi:hypothetical protein